MTLGQALERIYVLESLLRPFRYEFEAWQKMSAKDSVHPIMFHPRDVSIDDHDFEASFNVGHLRKVAEYFE